MNNWQKWKNLIASRLVNKLILFFSSILILVVVSLTFISYQMLQQEAIQSSLSSTSINLKLINQKLEEYVQEMEILSLPQINYDELTYALLNESDEYASRMFIEDYLRSLFNQRRDLTAIYLYVIHSHKYYEISLINNDMRVRTLENQTIPEESWYQEALRSPNNHAYQSLVYGKDTDTFGKPAKDDFFAYHRIIRSIATREELASLSFHYNSNIRDTILEDVPFDEGEQIMWLSPQGELFIASSQAVYRELLRTGTLEHFHGSQGQFAWKDSQHNYSVIYNIGDNGWTLVKLTPFSTINQAAFQTRNFSFLVGAIFLIAAIALVIVLSRQITKPLKRLSSQMKRFGTGDFQTEIEVVGSDELAYISRHFNDMVRQTNQLINEKYKLKLAEKNAILKALEAQINPHFLYNALQAVSTKALKNSQMEIADMVDALALSLRYCISGQDIVSAEEELRHIENYLVIQKERFGNRLQVKVEWDGNLRRLKVPKLSIQTLVENAVKHGLESMSKPITIYINAKLEDEHVMICVANDGPPIAPDKLREIRQRLLEDVEHSLQRTENIGLMNLNARLKLLYGSEAKLDITSNEQETKMLIILPGGKQP